MDRIDVTIQDIEEAVPVVQKVARRTPTIPLEGPEGEVWLKLENLQRLGVFKIRGAWNRISRLTQEERRRGVTTLSSGNHGRAVAWSARRLGLRCVIRVPEGAAPQKLAAIRAEAAEVIPIPRSELVRVHEDETWRAWPETYLPPFAHPLMIAGNGTAGLEIAEDVTSAKTVLVPVGGGGLATGIAIAVKARLPSAKVIGVQPEGAASLPTALKTGRGFHLERPETIADGIGVGLMLPTMVELLKRNLDGCLLVSDEEIRAAMRSLALDAKVVAEPAGAASFAGWSRHHETLESPVVAVVSGGNVDPALLSAVLK
ncbi:MAG: threonine/serine dehydratase [Methanobacteriota archaeon]|nr:MAG: threonine/serine dehydratase [Euryarchaeota archaeon]